jgi:triacylglycerol lipase
MNLVFASGFLLPQHLGPIEYFNGVRELVLARGHPEPLLHKVPPLADSKTRAETLASAIRAAFPAGPIHIVAHSMGGLDSRRLIASNPDLAARIVSLTMLSTPNQGSPLADLLAGDKPSLFSNVSALLSGSFSALRFGALYDAFRAVLTMVGINIGALKDLTKKDAEAMPDVATTHRQIAYRSYAASGRVPPPPTSKLLALSHEYILKARNGGPNDGAVTVESAKYGTFMETWPCDHLDQVGHDLDNLPLLDRGAFDHLAKFGEIIDRLQREHPGT